MSILTIALLYYFLYKKKVCIKYQNSSKKPLQITFSNNKYRMAQLIIEENQNSDKLSYRWRFFLCIKTYEII